MPKIGDTRDVTSPVDLAQATDAALDVAEDLLDGVDLTYVDPRVQQAVALITAAGVTVDQLLDVMGVADPDDEDDAEESGDATASDAIDAQGAAFANIDPGDATYAAAMTGLAHDAPRQGLMRTYEFRAMPGDGNHLTGIAAPFNDWATIADYKGPFREQIAPTAFNKTLRERKPILMFNHGKHPMVGDMPIGSFNEITPRKAGLYVDAQLSDNWLVSPVRDAIANESIPGMSFQFDVIKDDWTVGADNIPERTLREVALFELGPVVFPAYTNTAVSVRSREILTALEDPEARAELARALLIGTPAGAATAEPRKHSRTQAQNRALVRLSNI